MKVPSAYEGLVMELTIFTSDHECSNSHQDRVLGDDSNDEMSKDEAFENGGDEPEPTQVPEIYSESPSVAVEGIFCLRILQVHDGFLASR